LLLEVDGVLQCQQKISKKKTEQKRIRDEPLKISICKWAMSSRIFVEEKDQPVGLGGHAVDVEGMLHCSMFNSEVP